MSEGKVVLLIVALIALAGILYACSPIGRGVINGNQYLVQKVDDRTNYKTLREVEDTARAMISSYESDKLMYEQYRDASTEEQRSWSMQARTRANKTAAVYNNYILKNSFVWKSGVPADIKDKLEPIQ